jgi:hypothetical protein
VKKAFRSPREVVGEVQRLLAAKYSPQAPSPLKRVVSLLREERHYSWAAIYLKIGEASVREAASGPAEAPSASQASAIIRMTRELGRIEIRSEHADALTSEDRVLMKELAVILARYLTGDGKYLVRKAREAASAEAGSAPRRREPASDKGIEARSRRAAAGDSFGQ